MKMPRILLLVIILIMHASTVLAQIKFTSYKLTNGLRVLLAPDAGEANVAINITFDVGARNERPGQTGLANLLEHIVTENLQSVRGETDKLFGSTINQERTSYFADFPASRLDFVLSSLARQMREPDITQAKLDKQRTLITEERKQSDAKPYSAMDETLLDLIYSNFAYKHSAAGSPSDMSNLTLDVVRSFFKTYYAPNNAVISIVGNFDESDAKRLIEKYFKSIPRQAAPPRVDTSQATLTAERRKTISDPNATLPFYFSGYLTVPSDHPDWYALNLLADILGQGDTSRLHVALVQKNLALSVPEGVNESRAPGLFRMGAKIPAGGNVEMVESIIDAEVARIQMEGVLETEMIKARAQERQYSSEQLKTAPGRANFLSRTAVYYNDPNRINKELGRLLAVTKEDVQRVARKYLVKTNRAVVIVQPAASK